MSTAATAVTAVPDDCFASESSSSGGCFAGSCRVRMARDDVMLPIADLRRGDLVWTPDGPATILYAVELRTKARAQPMTQIGALTITPWHPIRRNGEWVFAAHVHGFYDRHVPTVYNLVLSRGHVIEVEGVECVTLAHGFVEPVLKHDFFGTDAVIKAVEQQPGAATGNPIYNDCHAIKDPESGLIIGWEDHGKEESNINGCRVA